MLRDAQHFCFVDQILPLQQGHLYAIQQGFQRERLANNRRHSKTVRCGLYNMVLLGRQQHYGRYIMLAPFAVQLFHHFYRVHVGQRQVKQQQVRL